ncbi:MAG: DUF4260 domain-containing protein [Myxococcota bacterium]
MSVAPSTIALSGRPTGATGAPRTLLHLEGAGLLAVATAVYALLGGSWGLYAALFLLPDLSMVGYLVNSRVGAALYNAAHTTLGPLAVALGGTLTGAPLAVPIALVWAAHIGFDRMFGYGLKYRSGFTHTHLSGMA